MDLSEKQFAKAVIIKLFKLINDERWPVLIEGVGVACTALTYISRNNETYGFADKIIIKIADKSTKQNFNDARIEYGNFERIESLDFHYIQKFKEHNFYELDIKEDMELLDRQDTFAKFFLKVCKKHKIRHRENFTDLEKVMYV